MQIRRRVRVVEAHLQPCSMTMLYFPQLWQCRRRAPVNATRRALRGAPATRSTLLKLQGCRGSEVASEANTDWRGHGPAAAEASREGKEKRRRRQRRGRSVDDVTVRTQYESSREGREVLPPLPPGRDLDCNGDAKQWTSLGNHSDWRAHK
jgi:hypothetical protein